MKNLFSEIHLTQQKECVLFYNTFKLNNRIEKQNEDTVPFLMTGKELKFVSECKAW